MYDLTQPKPGASALQEGQGPAAAGMCLHSNLELMVTLRTPHIVSCSSEIRAGHVLDVGSLTV